MTKPVQIRRVSYSDDHAAADALCVKVQTIQRARREGTLEVVGLGQLKRKNPKEKINIQERAEYFLEHIMQRHRWTPDLRDDAEEFLERFKKDIIAEYRARK